MAQNVAQLLVAAIHVYTFILLGRIILSWIPNVDRGNAVVEFLYQVTDPVLERARRIIPPIGMMDISPIVVFLALRLLSSVLMGMVADM